MKEAVSFEVAKLLKEKGFCEENVYCYYQGDYKNDSTDVWRSECKFNWNIYDDSYSAPTQQMAMRWLREGRGIHIYPIPVTGFHYVVSAYAEEGNKTYDRIMSIIGRHAYEDVVEAALKYVLKNLI